MLTAGLADGLGGEVLSSAGSPRSRGGSPAATGSRWLFGEADVEHRDRERRHELQQAEQDADVDVAEDLVDHEVVGVVGEQDVEEVPGQEERGHREDEAAVLAAQLLEPLGLLDGGVFLALTADVRRPRRCCSRMTSGARPPRRAAFGGTVSGALHGPKGTRPGFPRDERSSWRRTATRRPPACVHPPDRVESWGAAADSAASTTSRGSQRMAASVVSRRAHAADEERRAQTQAAREQATQRPRPPASSRDRPAGTRW